MKKLKGEETSNPFKCFLDRLKNEGRLKDYQDFRMKLWREGDEHGGKYKDFRDTAAPAGVKFGYERLKEVEWFHKRQEADAQTIIKGIDAEGKHAALKMTLEKRRQRKLGRQLADLPDGTLDKATNEFVLARLHLITHPTHWWEWRIKPTDCPSKACWNLLVAAAENPKEFRKAVLFQQAAKAQREVGNDDEAKEINQAEAEAQQIEDILRGIMS